MNVATLKSRLWTMLQPIMGGTVIWADQNGPRPALPYATLRLSVIPRIGTPHYSNPDNNGLQTVLAVRESIVQVQRFGTDSVAAVETFADKLALTTNLDKFSLQKIALFDVSSVTDVAQLLNGLATEPRASVDFSIRWVSDQTDNVGLIETVNSNGTIGPENTAKNQTYSVTVP
jgi:hypothetical protein